jgi:lipoprotein-releasing system permease protein
MSPDPADSSPRGGGPLGPPIPPSPAPLASFSLFLALQYLKPKRSYFSVITIITILGVLLGVAVLIIVLSVMSGFDDMWRDKILGFNAHLTVTAPGGLTDPDSLLATIRRHPDVTGAAASVEGPVVILHHGRVYTPVLRGVPGDQEATVSRIASNVIEGAYALDENQALIGRDLAARMGVGVGDTLLLNTPQTFMSKDEIHLPEELVVAGVFELGMWEYDMGFVLCGLEMGRQLYGMDSGAHVIRVMTRDPYAALAVARTLRAQLGSDVLVSTWMEQNRQLFGALRVEKNMMFFLLIFISIVAAFNITNTLITVTINKTREIGLLKAIGFPSGAIIRIFFWLGWIEGTIGTVCGIGTALVVLRYRNDLLRGLSTTFNMELFPKELYRLSEIPSRTSLTDVLIVAGCVIVISTLAGLIPAYRSTRLDPVQSLRHD